MRIARLAGLVALLSIVALPVRAEAPSTISPDEASALVAAPEGPLLLDVRTPAEFSRGHIPGALNVPVDELDARLADLGAARERGAIVYCERGPRATRAATKLRDAGFTSVRELDGSFSRWRNERRTIEGAEPGGL